MDKGERKETADRWRLLRRVEAWLELPMAVLGFVWLALLIIELTRGATPAMRALTTAIYVIFICDFLLRLLLAPAKRKYLRRNWLTAVALLVPAFRVARFARALRAVRGIRFVRVVSSFNRTMGSLAISVGRRGAGYVAALTVVVILAGAAGMFAFERETSPGFKSYGDALWFASMIVTTMGSQAWPVTLEGRLLALLLSFYALGILGYLTASLASFFVEAGDDAKQSATVAALEDLKAEVHHLRQEVNSLRDS